MELLDVSWFTDSMREGRPIAVETRHRIQGISPTLPEGATPTPVAAVSQYACQRVTTIHNNNKIFTDAFEVLAESYEFGQNDGACLAFRRAASVLKSLPQAVRHLGAVRGLPCLGEHAKKVVEEILEYGCSFEVVKILSDEKYQTLKLFTSVFGVGTKTAEKWYCKGLRSFREIMAEPCLRLNRMQQSGFLHHGDISRAVSRAEARALGSIIDEAARGITPDAMLALTGGFRRGKEFGHDVDFILTTDELGKENGLLINVIDRLRQQGILLYCSDLQTDTSSSTFDVNALPCGGGDHSAFSVMDRYPKCFLILRLDTSRVLEVEEEEGRRRRRSGEGGGEGDGRGWRAVRVDLVSPPKDRLAFALLGWTGSRQFLRDTRMFARRERHMLLDNHGLYDKSKEEVLAAETEKDIFAHLGLDYMEPWQRNA